MSIRHFKRKLNKALFFIYFMVASLQGVKPGSLVHRFITSGKPGNCSLCGKFVEKLEAHHVCYSPEITINLCHACHHRTHFWPQRLKKEEKILLLKKRFDLKTAHELVHKKMIGPAALSKLIAPSRSVFIIKQKAKMKIAHDQDRLPTLESLKKIKNKKLFKPVPVNKIKRVKASMPKRASMR